MAANPQFAQMKNFNLSYKGYYGDSPKEVDDKEILKDGKALGLSENGLKVLMARTLWKNERGKLIETPSMMYERTAQVIAEVEESFGTPKNDIAKFKKDIEKLLKDRDFAANRLFINAGRSYPAQQFAACYVIPIEDSLDIIFERLQQAAFIQKWDAAAGIDYSPLRARGSVISSTGGRASGPVSFMTLFDRLSEVISDGSLRRGANMGVLSVHHPDILEFIEAKQTTGVLIYFNVSVSITDEFMEAVRNKTTYPLRDPRSGKVVKELDANEVFEKIARSAWESAEPGLIFYDTINKYHPAKNVGEITAVNLCGEQPLLPWESCQLGNVLLSNMLKGKEGSKKIDWDRLEKAIRLGVRIMDNSIESNHYVIPEIENVVKNGNRKIGIGVMGYADMLIDLGISYNSKEGLQMGETIMKFINEKAIETSSDLAKKRGNFANFAGSDWEKKKKMKYMRNACVTTVAPTGTIGVINNCSSGLEPVYALAYTRRAIGKGQHKMEVLYYLNDRLEKVLKTKGLLTPPIKEEIINNGSIQQIEEIPQKIKEVFVTAMDIGYKQHVRMQAAFQKHCDSGITKTINMAKNRTPEDVKAAYLLAYKLKCKGITIYRDESRSEQVLSVGKKVRDGKSK